MAKKKNGKSQKKEGWDIFRVIRRLMRRKNLQIISGVFGGLLAIVGGLAAVFGVKRKAKNEKTMIRSAYLVAAILCLFMVFYGIYSLIYSNKSYPHVMVSGAKVGGKDKKAVEKVFEEQVKAFQSKTIKLSYKDKNWTLAPVDIRLGYDVKKTEQRIYEVGREKTFFGRMWSRLGLICKGHEVKPVYTYDKKALSDFIARIAAEVDVPEMDATGVIKNNNVTFVAERTGMRVEQVKLLAKVLSNYDQLSSRQIEVPVKASYPNVTLGDTEDARQKVMTMLKSRLTLRWQKGSWNVGPEVFGSWIKFKSEKVAGEKSAYRLTSYIGQDEVSAYLKKISKDIDAAPQNAKLAINGGQLTVIAPSVTGYAFDPAAVLGSITDSVTSGQTKEIQLAVKEVQPDVTDKNLNDLGIKEIVGVGATNFKGSSSERKANIANGMRIVNGTLIKPGEEFSAVKTIGNVDASTGFVLGLVIKGSKTQPEYGGGLCQVSSTLFRAALYSGLRITERAAHAYRVGYYETDGDGRKIGPGLDSTIYGPHPDLRFVNDTGHWILIQGKIEKTKLTFEFWGTKDGRVSTISAPTISNEKPAPADEYINTDTLYVGQKQQQETSHPGATVAFNYSVSKDGKEIFKKTFKSVYKPWGAKYLVGTKPIDAAAPAGLVPTATPVVTTPSPTPTAAATEAPTVTPTP